MKDILSPGINCSAISEASETGLLFNRAEVAPSPMLLLVDQLSNDPHSRLRRHPLLSDVAENASWIETLFPDGLPLDPDEPVFGADGYEQIPAGRDTLFPKGINAPSNLLSRGLE